MKAPQPSTVESFRAHSYALRAISSAHLIDLKESFLKSNNTGMKTGNKSNRYKFKKNPVNY
jgi:hypothetical protein